MQKKLIKIAKVSKAHGIKGQVKLISYASKPDDIFKYNLYDEALNPYEVRLYSHVHSNVFIASINNNISRNFAEEIAGLDLYITKDTLPQSSKDEFYIHDLIGLKILDPENNLRGKVLHIHNFGAGDIIEMEIVNTNKTTYLPFDKDFIKEINLNNEFIIFNFKDLGL